MWSDIRLDSGLWRMRPFFVVCSLSAAKIEKGFLPGMCLPVKVQIGEGKLLQGKRRSFTWQELTFCGPKGKLLQGCLNIPDCQAVTVAALKGCGRAAQSLIFMPALKTKPSSGA